MRSIFILLVLFMKFGLADAEIIEKYFGSTLVFLGLCCFTVLVAFLLFYSCWMDVRHWKRSIDVKAQSKLPDATAADFEQEPSRFANFPPEEENLITPQEVSLRLESTQVTTKKTESSIADKNIGGEKHIKIIQAMYNSSGRELPNDFQQNVESRRVVKKAKPPVVKLETISEEKESEKALRSAEETNRSLKEFG